MKTVDIKGKKYVMINERIKFFRESEDYKNWSMTSEVISHENGKILIKAIIRDDVGEVKATGLAQEKEGDGFINKTSYVENCETSAWGRALGNMGIGVDASIASAEEVQNAIKNQAQKDLLTPNHTKWEGAVKHIAEGGILEDVTKNFVIDDSFHNAVKEYNG